MDARLRRMNASMHVIYELDRAVALKREQPDCIVVYREFIGRDKLNVDNAEAWLWQHWTPDQTVARWRAEGHPEIVRYLLNEPPVDKRVATWLVEVMQLARAAGFTLCVGNFSVGSYSGYDVMDAGLLDGLMRACVEYGHYLGLHEYAPALMPLGVGKLPLNAALYAAGIQPDSFPSPHPAERVLVGDTMRLPNNFALFRFVWLMIRCREQGMTCPDILLTELGWDIISPSGPNVGADSLMERIRQKHGASGFDSVRGVLSLRQYYEATFPDLGFEGAVIAQLRWWRESARQFPELKGAALFAESANPRWADMDISGLKQVHDWLAAQDDGETAPAAPKPAPTTGLLRPTARLRVRQYPGTDSAIIEYVTPEERLEPLGAPECWRSSVGRAGEWLRVRAPGGIVGWVAAEFVR